MESSPPPIQGQLNLRPPQIAQPARHLLTQAHRHSARLLMTVAAGRRGRGMARACGGCATAGTIKGRKEKPSQKYAL